MFILDNLLWKYEGGGGKIHPKKASLIRVKQSCIDSFVLI